MAIINALTDTWNNVATTFTAIKMTVTDTTSASGSKLIDLLVGASSKFTVLKTGSVLLGTTANNMTSNYGVRFGNTANETTLWAEFNQQLDVGLGGANRYTFTTTYLCPVTTGAASLGATGQRWQKLWVDATNTAGGTTGNQTINKAAGTVNFAAAATAVTVTNSLVSTASLVFAVVRTNDTTAVIKNVVPGAGSFVITLNAAATAETSVGFFVIN